jgi:pimeloyl-ACP methyl ester carboxylesterase
MPQSRTFDVLGTRLAALQWGDPDGVPTLALHGWLDNAATFDRLAPQLAELNLVALDFAGHGHSSHRPAGVHYHSLLDIQDILGVADQLGWERFNVIGHSMGAGIATELTGLFPERVLRAVMIDGFLATGGAGPAERIDDNREAVRQMLASAGKRPPVYPSVDDMIRRVTEATDQSWAAAEVLVARGHREVAGGFTWRTDPRIRFRTPLRMAEEQIDELLRRATAPSLLLVAANGDRWYLDGLEARRSAHGSLTVERTGGPHHIHLEPAHCHEVGRMIREFLGLPVLVPA